MREQLTREQIIKQAASAMTAGAGRLTWPEWFANAEAALPIITKAITDRVRAVHTPYEFTSEFFGDKWLKCRNCGHNHPCRTVRLCDEIDAEYGVER